MDMIDLNKAAVDGENLRKATTTAVRGHLQTLTVIVNSTEALTHKQLRMVKRSALAITKDVRATQKKLKV